MEIQIDDLEAIPRLLIGVQLAAFLLQPRSSKLAQMQSRRVQFNLKRMDPKPTGSVVSSQPKKLHSDGNAERAAPPKLNSHKCKLQKCEIKQRGATA